MPPGRPGHGCLAGLVIVPAWGCRSCPELYRQSGRSEPGGPPHLTVAQPGGVRWTQDDTMRTRAACGREYWTLADALGGLATADARCPLGTRFRTTASPRAPPRST